MVSMDIDVPIGNDASRSIPGPSWDAGFGAFEIDATAWELRREGKRIPLGPQPVKLLHLLVTRRGELVAREEIYDLLWPDGEVDVNRATNSCIRQIRRAIGDEVGDHALIQTYPGRGYRFVEPPPGADSLVRGKRRWWILTAATAACVITLLLAAALAGPHQPPTISVLPFRALGSDSMAQLGAGIAEDLITGLARIDPARIRVLASGSAAAAAARGRTDYVVTGTLRVDSVGPVLTARLVRTRDGATVWVDRFERFGDGTLVMQREVAERIVEAVAPEIAAGLDLSPVRDPPPAARTEFLRATFFVRRGRELGLALSYLDTVIAKDRGFASAWSLRSDALFLLGAYRPARAAAEQALRLDPRDPHAHFILGNIHLITDWQWAAAEGELRRAIDLAPGTALYHLGYGYFLAAAGRSAEAIREAELAAALDPLSPMMLTEAGTVYLLSGDYRRAVRSCDLAVELEGDAGYAVHCATDAHVLAGHLRPSMIDRLARANGADPAALFANAGPDAGERLQVLRHWLLARLEARARLSPDSLGGHGWYDLAVAYARAGRAEEALDALERSAGARAIAFVATPVDPRLALLRTNRRFQALERSLGGRECAWDPSRGWRCQVEPGARSSPAAVPRAG
jgi:DNA-binding winged helix-turn-helix (wHTH) protein/TolB-like protein/tetratricopeptide (TPR) repeat protein